MGSLSECIFIYVRAQLVPLMDNMWIRSWAIFPQYVDGAFLKEHSPDGLTQNENGILFQQWAGHHTRDKTQTNQA